MLTALITMEEKNQNHHDAHCPRCRRANSISRQRMELFFPNWREAAKQAASMPVADEMPASASLKKEASSKTVKSVAKKSAATKTKTAAEKPAAAKRQRSSKPSTAKKTTPSTTSKASKTPKPKTSLKSDKKK